MIYAYYVYIYIYNIYNISMYIIYIERKKEKQIENKFLLADVDD